MLAEVCVPLLGGANGVGCSRASRPTPPYGHLSRGGELDNSHLDQSQIPSWEGQGWVLAMYEPESKCALWGML